MQIGFRQPFDYEKLNGQFGINSISLVNNGTEIMLEVSSSLESIPLLLDYFKLNNVALSHLSSRQLTLDDLFISMTGRRLHEDVN